MTKLAACLIVKDAEHTLADCLESLQGSVGGIFVYDTGSKDRTVRLAQSMGAIVQRGEWRDDFSWAKNKALAMPDDSYDWLMWVDADDILRGGNWLHRLVELEPGSSDGLMMLYQVEKDSFLWRERLFRRSSQWKWIGRVHEHATIAGRAKPQMGVIQAELVRMIHNPPANRPSSAKRNLRLMMKDFGADPSPRTLAYVVAEAIDSEDWDLLKTIKERPDWTKLALSLTKDREAEPGGLRPVAPRRSRLNSNGVSGAARLAGNHAQRTPGS